MVKRSEGPPFLADLAARERGGSRHSLIWIVLLLSLPPGVGDSVLLMTVSGGQGGDAAAGEGRFHLSLLHN